MYIIEWNIEVLAICVRRELGPRLARHGYW